MREAVNPRHMRREKLRALHVRILLDYLFDIFLLSPTQDPDTSIINFSDWYMHMRTTSTN